MGALSSSKATVTSSTNNKTPFIDKDTANIAYEETKRWIRQYDAAFDEFERIARNKPSPGIDKNLPKVTDGTMAAIVQEQPKRIVQQTPSGMAKCNDYPEYAAVADIVLTNKLIPRWKAQGTAIQKSWHMVGKCMTYGVQASYTYFTNSNGVMHTDFVLPYIKDVLSEKGKVFAPDSNILFMRSWYQPRDIKAIINKEKKLLELNPKYVSEWDLKLLAHLLDSGSATSKSSEFMTPAEREKGESTGGIEMIHPMQLGVGAEFYSFSPRFEQGKALRTKVNKDPRGKMPLDFMYCNIDLSNPRGRGQVELSGGVQNLIDQQMQMFQFMTTYQQAPALKTWGNVNKASLKFRPNAIWDMGSNPANKVERDMVSDVAITSFPGNFGLLKSQILALNSSQDNSISAQSGNPTQSKTPQGVKNQEARLGVSDNYLRKQYETWFQEICETNLNIFFSEMQGSEKIDLGPLEVKQLLTTPAKKFVKGEKLEVNYKDVSDVSFMFSVDPTTSKVSDNEEQLTKMQELITEIGASPLVINWFLGQSGKKLMMGELYEQRFRRLGLQNIDTILTDMDPKEAEAAKQDPFPIADPPVFRVNTSDLTAEQIAAVLARGGVTMPPPQQPPQPGAPPQGLSPQGIADFMVEMTKAQGASAASPSVDPTELAIKHRTLDLKQQEIAIKAHDSVSKGMQADQSHSLAESQHNLATLQALHDAQQPQDPNAQGGQTPAQQSDQSAQPQAPQQQPPQAQPQDQLHPEEQQIIQHILNAGFSPQDAQQAIVMLRRGMSEQQILQTLAAKRRGQ